MASYGQYCPAKSNIREGGLWTKRDLSSYSISDGCKYTRSRWKCFFQRLWHHRLADNISCPPNSPGGHATTGIRHSHRAQTRTDMSTSRQLQHLPNSASRTHSTPHLYSITKQNKTWSQQGKAGDEIYQIPKESGKITVCSGIRPLCFCTHVCM